MVGRVEIVLSLVETFIELNYFHGVATPALLCHKEPAPRIQSPLLVLYGIGGIGGFHRRKGRPYAIRNQLAEQHDDLGPLQCSAPLCSLTLQLYYVVRTLTLHPPSSSTDVTFMSLMVALYKHLQVSMFTVVLLTTRYYLLYTVGAV